MKKLLLLCFLLFTIIPFNSTHAASLNCTLVNAEMNNYPTYKVKIDSLFSKILEENTTVQEGYYKKLSTTTSKYLKQFDPVAQKKFYTILGYINCENDSRLLQNNGSYLLEDALDGYSQNLYFIQNNQRYYVDKNEGTTNNIVIGKKYMTYDWISTGGQIKKVYDIEKKEIIARVNRGKIIDNFIYGCGEYGYGPGYVELYYLDSGIFRDFSPVDTMVKECNFTDNHLYFTLINNEQITELQTVEQGYQHKFDIDNNQLYSRDIGNSTWIKVENSVVEQYPVQKNYINSKHLGNNFILKQTLEQSNLEYQGKTVKTWSHYSEKNPFIDIEGCNKLTKIILDNNYDYRNREDSWGKLSSNEQEECIAEHYNKSVEVKKTPHSRFFSIYKYFYEGADVSLFDSENLRIYEGSFGYSITKIEEGASGFFIQYFHPLGDGGGLKLLESNGTVTDLIENNCDGANTIVERVDCYSITDFELMINKQVKVFYTNGFDEKKEIILNIRE